MSAIWRLIALATLGPGILWAGEPGKWNESFHPPAGYSGHWVVYSHSGQKVCETDYVDGKPDGKQVYWHANGTKSSEIDYVKGQCQGKHTTWHPNGTKASEADFAGGELQGSWTYWNEKGELRDGTEVQLYGDGKRKSEEQYRQGKRYGTFSHWYEDGQKAWEESFKNGKRDGESKGWYRNGQMQRLIEFKDEKKHGRQVSWLPNGWKEDERVFEDGKCVREVSVTGTLSPKEWGIRQAKEDFQNGKKRIYYYGKPYGGPQPPKDTASGLPLEIVAGCCVTREFTERVDAYNETMRGLAR